MLQWLAGVVAAHLQKYIQHHLCRAHNLIQLVRRGLVRLLGLRPLLLFQQLEEELLLLLVLLLVLAALGLAATLILLAVVVEAALQVVVLRAAVEETLFWGAVQRAFLTLLVAREEIMAVALVAVALPALLPVHQVRQG
jgi:hypothetical protein